MGIFIEYPLVAAGIGLLLLGLGRRTGRGLAVAVGGLWLLYAGYETGMQRRWFCTGECNIRVDLLAIYPVLLVGLLASGVSLLRGSKGRGRG